MSAFRNNIELIYKSDFQLFVRGISVDSEVEFCTIPCVITLVIWTIQTIVLQGPTPNKASLLKQ